MKINSVLILIMISSFFLSSCMKKQNNDSTFTSPQVAAVNTNAVYTAAVIKGNVTWSEDDSLWNRVETNMKLDYGIFVETGKKSGATLVGSIGDMVQMSEQAKVRLNIEELQKQGEKASLALRGIRLLRGKVKFDVKTGGKFTVETLSAKVNVKGTVFVVDVDSTGKTDVAVIEGIVDVIPLKDTSHVNILLRGNVLRNAGNTDAQIDSCNKNDTMMVSEESTVVPAQLSTGKGSISLEIGDPTSALNDQEAKNKLTPTPGYHGKKTQQEGLAASKRIIQEEQATLQKIEAEKAAFEENKISIENEHAIMKTVEEKKPELAREESQKKLDNERSASETRMDAERAKTEAKFAQEKNNTNDKTDAERRRVEKRLMKERASVKSLQGGIDAYGADDAFNELERKRGM